MIVIEAPVVKEKFTKDAISRQLEKITCDPIFADSGILKRFLSFVVEETLNEHSNRLKEYTIAVNVLDKPQDFKPQESGIVRIHAGRLRRALNYYYATSGLLDTIRILIPKGSYVPSFVENEELFTTKLHATKKPLVVGVAPFIQTVGVGERNSFSDGLVAQLTTSLMTLENVSVISFGALQNLLQLALTAEQLTVQTNSQLLITGNIQIIKSNLRAHIQVVRTHTSQIVWSHMIERKFSNNQIFEIQDEIVQLVIEGIRKIVL